METNFLRISLDVMLVCSGAVVALVDRALDLYPRLCRALWCDQFLKGATTKNLRAHLCDQPFKKKKSLRDSESPCASTTDTH